MCIVYYSVVGKINTNKVAKQINILIYITCIIYYTTNNGLN